MAKEPKKPAEEIPEGYSRVIVMAETGIWLSQKGDADHRRFKKGDIVVIPEAEAAQITDDRIKVI